MGSRFGTWRSPQMGVAEPEDYKVNGAMNRFAACLRFPRSRFPAGKPSTCQIVSG